MSLIKTIRPGQVCDLDPTLKTNGFVEPIDLTREGEVFIELTDGTQIIIWVSEWGNLYVKQPGEAL